MPEDERYIPPSTLLTHFVRRRFILRQPADKSRLPGIARKLLVDCAALCDRADAVRASIASIGGQVMYGLSGFRAFIVVLLSVTSYPAHAVLVNMSASLSGAQEVPANGSTGTGSAAIVFDDVSNELD